MNFVNNKKSENGYSPFLLIWVICVIVFAVIGLITNGINFIFIILIFLTLPILYILDIFFWNTIGKEIIYTQNEKLIIRKTNRVFQRKKRISFKKIEDIYLWEAKGFFKESFAPMFAFWDLDKQGKICVKYDNGCEYYIGRNLSKKAAEELLEMLKSEIVCTPTKASLKSKVIEAIILILLVLLIFFIAWGGV